MLAPRLEPTCFKGFLEENFSPSSNMSLSQMIGARQSVESVIAKIAKLSSDGTLARELTKPVTRYKVTALHIAAMRGNQQIFEALLAHNPPLGLTDDCGCTPLHIAAITANAPFLDAMHTVADRLDLTIRRTRNNMRATAEEILNSHWIPRYPPNKIVGYYKDEAANLKPLTPGQFHKILGFHFCPSVVSNSEYHHSMWIKTGSVSQWRPIPLEEVPPLYFQQEKWGAVPLGWGVRAKRPIQAFEFLDVYGGMRKSKIDSNYGLNDIDAIEYGTISSRINDGDPNVSFDGGFRAGNRITFIRAVQPIAIDEPVLIHYGYNHPCKWGRYVFTPHADFYEFIKHTKFLSVLENIDKQNSRYSHTDLTTYSEEYLSSRSIAVRVNYIFETPFVLAQLLLKRELNISTCIKVLKYKKIQREDGKNYRFVLLLKYIASVIDLVEATLEGHEILAYFSALLDQHRVLFVLQEIRAFLGNRELIDLKVRQANIEKRLLIKEKLMAFTPQQLTQTLQKQESLYHALLEDKDLRIHLEEAYTVLFLKKEEDAYVAVIRSMFS